MTEKEVLKILAICRDVGVPFSNADSDTLVEVWLKCFASNTYKEVSNALFVLINSKEPLFVNGLIGRIKEQIVLNKTKFLDFTMAWELIEKAAHKTHPDIPEETEKAYMSLPPILRYLVGSARHLEDMEYCLERNVLETVEKSNMRKMYESLVAETKEDLAVGKLPKWQLTSGDGNKMLFSIAKLLEGKTFGEEYALQKN